MRLKPARSLVLFAIFSGIFAVAQQPDGGPPPPGQHAKSDQNGEWGGGMRSGFHIGPPGIWWHNADLIQKLTLTADQQKRMDDILQQNRSQLVDLRTNLQKQETLIEPMLAADQPDTNKILAQVDVTIQARAELEKATARMLLSLRSVLTADQWSKLQSEERENRRMFMRHGGPPGSPGSGPGHAGPGGPGGGEEL